MGDPEDDRQFPQVVYNHARSRPAYIQQVIRGDQASELHFPAHLVTKIVYSKPELELALAEGWKTDPPPQNIPTDSDLYTGS